MNAQEKYLQGLAERICIYFPGWNVRCVQSTSFQLDGPGGRGMIFWACAGTVRLDAPASIRLEIGGIYDLNAYIRAEDKPRITLSAKKGAEAIAKDVQRRFLPKYEAVFVPALKTHNETMRLRDARNRVLIDLAQVFGWKVVDDQHGKIKHIEEAPYRSRADAILGNSMRPHEEDGQWYVDLELKRIPVGVAYRIADAFKEPTFPPLQLALPLKSVKA